jgi:acyl carrier protein
MNAEIFKKVSETIAANNHIPIEQITLDSTFEELNMDSLDGITLINDLENNYKIMLTNEEAMQIKTVSQAVEIIEQKFNQQ